MTQINLTNRALKRVLKEVLVEVLHEEREVLYDVLTEVLEDFTLAEAIRDGQKCRPANRNEVFRILPGRA